MNPFHTGVVALVGRPNAGKSTLLNALVGSRLAIVSSKPQTTRERIAGIVTDARMQALVIDTPGLHKAWTELNKVMVRKATDALEEANVLVWVEDLAFAAHRVKVGEPIVDETAEVVLERIARLGKPVVLVANKIDVVAPEIALPVIDAIQQRIPLAAAIPLSALKQDGVADLRGVLADLLPEGTASFPEDQWTTATERFLVAEAIREKIFHLTEQEVPYATAIEVETFDETEREVRGLVRIHAALIVERPAQKAILIGKGGDMIKRIGSLARKDIEEILDCRVHLELFVKVEKDWTRTTGGLRRVGFK